MLQRSPIHLQRTRAMSGAQAANSEVDAILCVPTRKLQKWPFVSGALRERDDTAQGSRELKSPWRTFDRGLMPLMLVHQSQLSMGASALRGSFLHSCRSQAAALR